MSLVVSSNIPIASGAGGSVSNAPVLSVSGTPPQGKAGTAYSWTPTITGVQGNLRVSLDGGLPNGIAVNSSTGEVRGLPVTEQTIGCGLTFRDDFNVAFLPGLTFTVTSGTVTPSARLIVIDTDMLSDCDDVAAVQIAAEAHVRGTAKILAVTANSSNAYSAPASKGILNAAGLPSVPIGANQANDQQGGNFLYALPLRNEFGTPSKTRSDYPSAVAALRTALVAADVPANSVHLLAIGPLNVISALLQSAADSISSLTGTQIVSSKVARIVVMGGAYPSGSEFNFQQAPAAASYVFANTPVEIHVVGFALGNSVFCGPPAGANPAINPVRRAWNLSTEQLTNDKRQSWDPLATAYATGEKGDFFTVGPLGDNVVDASTGANSWTANPNGKVRVVSLLKTTAETGAMLDGILAVDINPARVFVDSYRTAGWSTFQATRTFPHGTQKAPDGSDTARIVDTAQGGAHVLVGPPLGTLADREYETRMLVKADGISIFRWQWHLAGNDTPYVRATFDLTTNTMTLNAGVGGATFVSGSVTDDVDGWKLVRLRGRMPVANWGTEIVLQKAAGTDSYTGTLQGIFIAKPEISGPFFDILTLTRAADGSVGQVYTASAAGQWVTRTNAGAVSPIAGQTGSTYTAQAADVGKTIGVRNLAGVVTYAAGPVMGAVLVLDAMDTTTGHTALGASTTLTLRTDRKIQGAGALQADGVASTNLAGVDFTGTDSIDPSTLGVIAFSSDRLTEGVITGHQVFVHAGTPNGNVLIQNEQLQLTGQRFTAFNSSEIAGIQGQPAAAIRTRVGMIKGTSTAASTVFDAMLARAGGRPQILLSFDDGYKTIRNTAYGELNSRGLKATVFPAPTLIQSGGTGDFEWMTVADLQFLHAQGWDIGCDGTMDDTAMSTTPADAVTNINQVRAFIEANVGTRASRFFCYPFGNHQNEGVAQAIIDAGFLTGRGTQLPGTAHTRFGVPVAVRKKLPSTGIATASVVSTLLAKVDEAISRGLTASFHMHSFTESTGNSVFIPASVYQPFLDGLASRRDAGSLDVLTYSEWWARDGGSSLPV